MAPLPLFPTSVVGSMPRPQFVRDLLRPETRQALGNDEFTRRLDIAVAYVVAMQEAAGLDVISDGEWRRLSYIGVAKFSASGGAQLREHYHRCRGVCQGGPFREAPAFEKAYLIHLFQEMIEAGERFVHVDTPGGYMEIDTQQDFDLAQRFWR